MLGSCIFPMHRHLAAGVRFAEVGAGTGFGMLKESLQCSTAQRLRPDGMTLSSAQLLYLATRADAEGLGHAWKPATSRPKNQPTSFVSRR